MKVSVFIKLLTLLAAIQLGTLTVAMAQPATSPAAKAGDPFTYYYRDPRPERLVGALDALGKKPLEWIAYPPVAGLLAVVFAAQPGWIGKLVPAQLDARLATTIAAGLELSGQPVSSDLQARLVLAGTDPTLAAQFAGLPNRLTDLRISIPTHLDVLWGASFASGDGRYVLMIIDFMSRTANRSEPIALDIVRVAAGAARKDFGALASLKDKYDQRTLVDIAYAATAAWALTSNARQHGFVDATVKRYITEHSGTWAGKVLAVLKAS